MANKFEFWEINWNLPNSRNLEWKGRLSEREICGRMDYKHSAKSSIGQIKLCMWITRKHLMHVWESRGSIKTRRWKGTKSRWEMVEKTSIKNPHFPRKRTCTECADWAIKIEYVTFLFRLNTQLSSGLRDAVDLANFLSYYINGTVGNSINTIKPKFNLAGMVMDILRA